MILTNDDTPVHYDWLIAYLLAELYVLDDSYASFWLQYIPW